MSLIGFQARNHPQQVATSGRNDSVDDRSTPADLFDALHAEFAFTVDVAASQANAKLDRFFTAATDGLAQPWAAERVWCNPPFSTIRPWLEKAWTEPAAEVVVMLLPANRTDQRWWADLVEPFRDRPGSPLTVRFLAGRPRFTSPTEDLPGRPPFGCCVLVWDRRHPVAPNLLTGAAS